VIVSLVLAGCIVSLPSFLVAAQAVQIRAEMHFSPPELGVVLACYYAGSAIFAFPGGNLAELLGGPRLLRYCMMLSACVLLGAGYFARSWQELCGAMVVAGAASTAAQASSNLVISRRVGSAIQGVAFGLKQGAVPLAFLAAGAAVPAVALTLGWRWSFLGATALAIIGLALAPHPRGSISARMAHAREHRHPEASRPLVILAVGFGLALMSCASLSTYLVSSSVASGLTPGGAGIFATATGLGSFAVRVGSGVLADRRKGGDFTRVVVMLLIGAIGFLAMSASTLWHLPGFLLLGGFTAFAVGWGWNGLFNLAIVRTHNQAPARATGLVQSGGRLGSLLGPLAFAFILAHSSYWLGWIAAALEAAAGAAVILLGSILVRRTAGKPDNTRTG
jgi:MFS family permease